MAGKRLTRREFGLSAAGTLAATLLPTTTGAGAATEPSGEAAVTAAVDTVRRLAPHLPTGDEAELRSQVKSVLEMSRDLATHRVHEGAEPDFVYDASRRLTREDRRGR